ncbi:MAG: putative Ig domain-containing protein, partial [Alcanivorax sp.]|nr:putative Ig domain-containing protein [Alcanivorax sp.]
MLLFMMAVLGVRTTRSRASGCMGIFSALLVLFAATMWSGTALANCSAQSPIAINVDSGATYTIDLTADYNDCAPFGITMTDPLTTAHGTVTHNNFAGSGNVQIYYANNGDGATMDTFTFDDGSGFIVTVNVTINPSPISVTPSSVSDATVGVGYAPVNFTASGGVTPYTYLISAGSLPAGMNLSTNGTLSGTPTEAGAFNFTVQAKDANNVVGSTSSISMTVNAPTITVAPGPGAIASPQVGAPYSQQFSASGGTPGSGYTVVLSGAVPPGLSLSSSGLLSGTPTSASSSTSFTVTATDQSTGTGAPFSGAQLYTVSVAGSTLSMSPASGTTLTAATQGSSYSQQFTASGGTSPYNYQVTGGTLPNGLSLGVGGQLSGTPTQAGTFNFTVTATDSSTGTGSPFSVAGSYTLNVQAIVPVANAVSDTVSYGSSSNVVPTSFTGGTPTSVAIASPASHGTATASGTTITYTPTAGYTGTDSFTYTGTNSAGTSLPATVSITVSGPTLAITSSSGGTSLTATVGQSFTQTFTFSGGQAPYQGYSISGIPAGLSVTAFDRTSITISGAPTVSGTFTLKVSGTDSSTGTDPGSGKNAPFTVSQSFALQINAASMSVSPASGTLTNATSGTAYNQLITAGGGISPYTYTVTSGSLPSGVILTAAGILKGTPSAVGTFQFQVTATDSSTGAGSPATASASYTLNVDPPPIPLSPSALPNLQQGTAYSQQLSASGGTSPYTYAVTSGSLPTGLTLSSTGLISGTPTASGPYNFTVTATDATTGSAAPYTGSQVYAVTVGSNPPIVSDDTASTPSQQAVTIPVTSNDSGTISSIALASTPSHGTATVNGTSVVYTPQGTFFGTDTFTYKATGPGGTSQPATVTVQINPLLQAPDLSANAMAGTPVTINLTDKATGGPFTGANLVSISPSTAGNGQIQAASGGGYQLQFTPSSMYSGTVSVVYTLKNAYATSAKATITIHVTARPDPGKDAEVRGLLNAQTDSTRRFARGQLDNFNSRLASLHAVGGREGRFTSSLTLNAVSAGQAGNRLNDPAMPSSPDAPVAPTQDAAAPFMAAAIDPDAMHFWLGGTLNFGTSKAEANSRSIDFTTSGVSVGADRRMAENLVVGGGIGYGHDASDVGSENSRSTADAYSLAMYASYRPAGALYLDALAGYQWLAFDAHRYVAADGSYVAGQRDGRQLFGALSLTYEYADDSGLRLSPYGRFDLATATLDGYTEHGASLYALHYNSEDLDTATGAAGVRVSRA